MLLDGDVGERRKLRGSCAEARFRSFRSVSDNRSTYKMLWLCIAQLLRTSVDALRCDEDEWDDADAGLTG